jgi:TRAP-type transport system periplasmic protein
MEMRKILKSLFLVVVILLVLGSWSMSAEVTLQWGGVMSPTFPWSIAAIEASEEIYERTDGRIKIDVYHSGQLGTEAELIEQLVVGSIAMATSGPTILADYNEDLKIFTQPYIFRDEEHANKFYDSEIAREMFAKAQEKSGVMTIAGWYYGTRHMTTAKGIIVQKPEDLKGIKIRCPDYQPSVIAMRALGATPTPLSFSELYMALQTGVVDGQENPLTTILDQHFYEVQSNIILTGHSVHMGTVHFSEKIWNELTEEDREIIREVVQSKRSDISDMINNLSREALLTFIEKRMNIIQPDVEAFREHASKNLFQEFPELQSVYNEISEL